MIYQKSQKSQKSQKESFKTGIKTGIKTRENTVIRWQNPAVLGLTLEVSHGFDDFFAFLMTFLWILISGETSEKCRVYKGYHHGYTHGYTHWYTHWYTRYLHFLTTPAP